MEIFEPPNDSERPPFPFLRRLLFTFFSSHGGPFYPVISSHDNLSTSFLEESVEVKSRLH